MKNEQPKMEITKLETKFFIFHLSFLIYPNHFSFLIVHFSFSNPAISLDNMLIYTVI